MKVSKRDTTSDKVTAEHIREGECFRWEGKIYMRIQPRNGINSVDLSDGSALAFRDQQVERVVAEVVYS